VDHLLLIKNLIIILLFTYQHKKVSHNIILIITNYITKTTCNIIGITSQIRQIERLWRKADIVNRSITIRNFESYHFSDVSRVDICNLFNFPHTIKCSNDSLIHIVHEHKCLLIQNHTSWSSNPLSYMLPKDVARQPDFDVSKVDCIAGFIHENEGVLPIGVNGDNFRKFDNLSISNYYYKMLPNVRKVLNITTQEFVTLHWRRGDQLESRCPENRNQKRFRTRDVSINCHSVEDFINVTKSLLIKENIKNSSVIVATNEQSQEVLILYNLSSLYFIINLIFSNY